MFQERMTSNELLEEYRADLPELVTITQRFNKSDYVARYLRKHRKEPLVSIPRIFKTERGNKYLGIIHYCQIGIGKQKRWDFTAIHNGLMETDKGTCAIMFYNKTNQAVTLTPHFFERYKERFIEVCDWKVRSLLHQAKSITDVMAVYMKRNPVITWIETNSVFHNKVHVFGPVNDGVALLQWDKDTQVLQANTFLTKDMLDDKQKELVKYAKIYLSLPQSEKDKFKFPEFVELANKNDKSK